MLTFLLIAALALAALLAYAATRPGAFRLERSTVIAAPAEKVFALIDNFHHWSQWSPWEHIDPALKRSYSGPAAGRGAGYQWEGNRKVGSGSMEIIESVPASKVVLKLDFLKPFEAHNTTEFTIKANDGATHVSWVMYGPNNFIAKLMQTFVSMDKMVGGQFEQGLAQMKSAAEK